MTRSRKTRIAHWLYRWVLKLDPNTELEYRLPRRIDSEYADLNLTDVRIYGPGGR